MSETEVTSESHEHHTVREQIIALLTYPQTLLQAKLHLEECTHGGLYARGDRLCHECEDKPECEWLFHFGEYASLADKSETELLQAIEFALDYVNADVVRREHDSTHCDCESCNWLRRGQQLFDAAAADSSIGC